MAIDPFAENQDQPKVSYRPSVHKFTDPVRLFKSNDPYHWKVDNIALEQLNSNVLWLKDQVGSDGSFDGVTRKDFNELRPSVTGNDRSVTVSPGRFTARVNDAFGTGITSLIRQAFASMENENVKSKVEFELDDSVLNKLVGKTLESPIYNNGLYDHIQHHTTGEISGSYTVAYTAATKYLQNAKQGVDNLPKIKLALWKQATTANNYKGDQVDLQQLSVEFTRRWGAPFRTALVNVKNSLAIEIPEFDDTDYANESAYVPSVRVDLLFVYTKPIDASATAIARKSGDSVVKITSPQLGLVKGAGVVSLNPQGPAWTDASATGDFLASDQYQNNKAFSNNYFEASGGTDADGNTQISSPITDQMQSQVGIDNVYSNFPSPDDLMNLAPYVAEGLASNNMALVGQSVLPLAYVFVKKGQTTVYEEDIIDIRPFFRTAELTYNERSGVAAANPPLSLANPAVGKAELHKTAKELRDFTLANQPEVPEFPRPVAAGMVFGGTRWGVEGAIVRMGADGRSGFPQIPVSDIANQTVLTQWFKDHAGLPPTATAIPEYPDWDISIRAAKQFSDPGTKRNDRYDYSLLSTDREATKFLQDDTIDASDKYGDRVKNILGSSYSKYYKSSKGKNYTGALHAYLRKRVDIDRSQVPWMVDYDVKAEFQNCIPCTTRDHYMNHSQNDDQFIFTQFSGIHIEKYLDHFVIVVSVPLHDPRTGTGDWLTDQRDWMFTNSTQARNLKEYAPFVVTHEAGHFIQAKGSNHSWSDGNNTSVAQAFVTYPTVKFNVIGYPSTFGTSTNLGSNSTLTLG